jgi:hypothetical protein
MGRHLLTTQCLKCYISDVSRFEFEVDLVARTKQEFFANGSFRVSSSATTTGARWSCISFWISHGLNEDRCSQHDSVCHQWQSGRRGEFRKFVDNILFFDYDQDVRPPTLTAPAGALPCGLLRQQNAPKRKMRRTNYVRKAAQTRRTPFARGPWCIPGRPTRSISGDLMISKHHCMERGY